MLAPAFHAASSADPPAALGSRNQCQPGHVRAGGQLDDHRRQRQQPVGDEDVDAVAQHLGEALHDRTDGVVANDSHHDAEDALGEVVDQHLEAHPDPGLDPPVEVLEHEGRERPHDHRAQELGDVGADDHAHGRDAGDHGAVLQQCRGLLGECAVEFGVQFRVRLQFSLQGGQASRRFGRECRLQLRDAPQRLAQAAEVARVRRVQGDTGKDAFHVAQAAQPFAQGGSCTGVAELGDCIEAVFQPVAGAQRFAQPGAQSARTHGGERGVEDPEQRGSAGVGQIVFQLEVPARRFVEQQALATMLADQAVELREAPAAGVARVDQQRARRAQRNAQVFGVEPGEVAYAELAQYGLAARADVEVPRRTRARHAVQGRQGAVLGVQHFGGGGASQCGQAGIALVEFGHAQFAGGEIQQGEAPGSLPFMDGSGHGGALFVEQAFLDHGAGRQDARHLAAHRSLAAGLADLLRDHHALAQFEQAREVAVHRMHGYAGHRDRRAGGLAARGQGDIEQVRGTARVVVEKLVEIAHTVEQQLLGVLGLDAEVLLDHRGVCVGGGGHLQSILVRGPGGPCY